MKHLTNLREGKKIFEALNSDVRVSILEMLMEHKELNLDNFAKELKISNSAVTMHIKKLLDADLIKITPASGIRGSMKLCSLNIDKLLINFDLERLETSVYSFELDIGHYVNYEVMPTCGLVSSTGIIGEFDEPRYFSFPERFQAALLWFQSGFLEYKIPNALKPDETVKELQVSMEIASEAPGFSSNYPSDIHFSINNVNLGYWTSPGEFNDRRGNFTPAWWFPNLGQYGKLKMLSVNESGTYIDGILISNTTIKQLNIAFNSDISFKILVPKDAVNVGGLTLFGKGFGDYNSGIEVKMYYEKNNNSKRQ